VPHFDLVQLREPAEVEALTGAPDGMHDAYCWAWEDEVEGRVRSRCFVPGFGIAEDPATGAAAAQMALVQRRPLLIRQGTGSILMARSSQYGDAEVGGLVVLDEEGDYHLD
jgi:predicted PhzF superfamily epimerase YddE/YHI9